jgi:hypothetical protein
MRVAEARRHLIQTKRGIWLPYPQTKGSHQDKGSFCAQPCAIPISLRAREHCHNFWPHPVDHSGTPQHLNRQDLFLFKPIPSRHTWSHESLLMTATLHQPLSQGEISPSDNPPPPQPWAVHSTALGVTCLMQYT